MWSHAAAAGYRNISFRTLPPTQVIYIFTSTTFIVHWKQENEENILWRFINNIGLVKERLKSNFEYIAKSWLDNCFHWPAFPAKDT